MPAILAEIERKLWDSADQLLPKLLSGEVDVEEMEVQEGVGV
jgi:hypothetical protein